MLVVECGRCLYIKRGWMSGLYALNGAIDSYMSHVVRDLDLTFNPVDLLHGTPKDQQETDFTPRDYEAHHCPLIRP